MNCRQTRRELASWIGEPLDEETEQRLRLHLSECPACHAWYRQLQDSLELLHHLECRPREPDGLDLWPRVEPRMSQRAPSSPQGGSSAWMVVLVAAALGGLGMGLVPQVLPSAAPGAGQGERVADRSEASPLAAWYGDPSDLLSGVSAERDPWTGVLMSSPPLQIPDLRRPALIWPGRHSALLVLEYDCPHCGRCVAGAIRWHRHGPDRRAEAP